MGPGGQPFRAMSVLPAHHDVPGLDTPRQDEAVLHVRLVPGELLRDRGRVRPEHEDCAAGVFSDRSGHDDLTAGMRLLNQTEMLTAKRRPPVHVIVDDRVITQDEVAHTLTL